jgi:glycosyltransferase involved in cell wall biosynthesis
MSASTPSPHGITGRILNLLASERQYWRLETQLPHYGLPPTPPDYNGLPFYAIDMAPVLLMPFGGLDDDGVLYNAATHEHPASYQPTNIAQYALAHWNQYLISRKQEHADAFMRQARWLLAHETPIAEGVAGWPIAYPAPRYGANANWLSALAQGNVISVFVRAYKLTGDAAYLDSARRAARTFTLDALDGGVSVPVGDDGIYFEEVAAYPASHVLTGYVLALFGLYDYVALTHDEEINSLIERSLDTFHDLVDEYDAGYWSRYDLLHGHLAPQFYHALHVSLMQALAWYNGCHHCRELAERWRGYQQRPTTRLRYWVASCAARYVTRGLKHLRLARGGSSTDSVGHERVIVPVTAFPMAGGTRSVLAGVSAAMADTWSCEYLTRIVGDDRQGMTIYRFGPRFASHRYALTVFLYVMAGRRKLVSLLRRSHRYRVVLPQDGVYTAAYAAAAGKALGVRVVCMDHGSITLPFKKTYLAERIHDLQHYRWPARMLLRLGLIGYMGALRRLARVATRHADGFLVAGDEVYDVYRERFGVARRRITRYPYVVDLERFRPAKPELRTRMRGAIGLNNDDLVITMINRLSPEKGLGVALQGIALAVSALQPHERGRIRVIIGGDGPSRRDVEAGLQRHGLEDVCALWGEVAASDVPNLLAVSDIFLYTGTRGTNYSMAVLEAMASGCAVVASVEPRSNAHVLANNRGTPLPVDDAAAVGKALAELIAHSERRNDMGRSAREYIERYHSPIALKRSLLRATFWPGWSGGVHLPAHAVHTASPTLASARGRS